MGEAKDILNRGCDTFSQKPFNMKQLSRSIRETLIKNNPESRLQLRPAYQYVVVDLE